MWVRDNLEKENRRVFVNKKSYEADIEKLGYKPDNLYINEAIPDNQATILNDEPYQSTFNKIFQPLALGKF
jgi:hypothetical protein